MGGETARPGVGSRGQLPQLWARTLWSLPLALGRQVGNARQGGSLPALRKRMLLAGMFRLKVREEGLGGGACPSRSLGLAQA